MSGERVDPELLAAFLDGTASPEEREGVLRTIARSKDAYAEFVEAAAIHRELAGEAASDVAVEPVPPGTARAAAASRWSRRWYLAPIAIAAGIVAVLITRGGAGPSSPPASIQLVQATRLTTATGPGTMSRTFGDTWNQPPWSVVRGGERTIGPNPLAFRAGARYAELELGAQANDSAAVIGSATELAQLLSSADAGAPVAQSFQDIARAPNFGGSAQRAAIADVLRRLLGAEDWFDLGAWAETARLAVGARDIAFFQPGGRGTTELRRILAPHVDPSHATKEWGPTLEALRPLLADRSWSPADLDSLAQAVNTAITAAAR